LAGGGFDGVDASDADPSPYWDHSSGSATVRYPSNGESIDTGLPAPSKVDSFFDNPWLGLAEAGLGIMASGSPYPGVAIGQGGLTGIQQFEQGRASAADTALRRVQTAEQQQQSQLTGMEVAGYKNLQNLYNGNGQAPDSGATMAPSSANDTPVAGAVPSSAASAQPPAAGAPALQTIPNPMQGQAPAGIAAGMSGQAAPPQAPMAGGAMPATAPNLTGKPVPTIPMPGVQNGPPNAQPMFNLPSLAAQARVMMTIPGMSGQASALLGMITKAVPEGMYLGQDGAIYPTRGVLAAKEQMGLAAKGYVSNGNGGMVIDPNFVQGEASVAGAKANAEMPAKIAEMQAIPRTMTPGSSIVSGSKVVAQSAMPVEGVGPDGRKYRIWVNPQVSQGSAAPSVQGYATPVGGGIAGGAPQAAGIAGGAPPVQTASIEQTPEPPMPATATPQPTGAPVSPANMAPDKLASYLSVATPAELATLKAQAQTPAVQQAVQAEMDRRQAAAAPQAAATPPVAPLVSGIKGQQNVNPGAPAIQPGVMPGGPIATELSPMEKESQREQAAMMEKGNATLNTTANQAVNNNFTIDQMRNESQTWRQGWGATQIQSGAAMLQGLYGIAGIKAPNLDNQVGDFNAFQKNAMMLTQQVVRQTSSRAAVQEFQMIQKALPSADMSHGGFDQVANQLQAVNDFTIAKQQAAQAWRQTHDGTLQGFDTAFNQTVTPSVFWAIRTYSENPAEYKAAAAKLSATPGGKNVLNSITKQYIALQQLNMLPEVATPSAASTGTQ